MVYHLVHAVVAAVFHYAFLYSVYFRSNLGAPVVALVVAKVYFSFLVHAL